jgi:hypothetical protein
MITKITFLIIKINALIDYRTSHCKSLLRYLVNTSRDYVYGHVYGLTKGGLSYTHGELFWTLVIVIVAAQIQNRLI